MANWAATGISWKMAESSARLAPGFASCMMANAASASCAPGKATRWCSRLMAAHQAFAWIQSKKNRLIISCPALLTLSFGTAGCNLTCKFCQNWDISKAETLDQSGCGLAPGHFGSGGAKRVPVRCIHIHGPVIFLEYAVDVAQACRERGIKTVAVSAGYISPEPRTEFFRHIEVRQHRSQRLHRRFLQETLFRQAHRRA